MTFPDLQETLKTVPGGRLSVDGSKLSTSVASLFADFLSGTVIEFQEAAATPNPNLGSVHVVGTLTAEFLGVRSRHVKARFFLISGDVEVEMTFAEMPDLSPSFQKLAERAAFSKCVFTLDSRRPDPVGGDDFNAFFGISDLPVSKRGLGLRANLQVSTIDETLAEFGIQSLTVEGPVELAEEMPRMRLAAKDPVVSFEFQGIALKLDYEYLTAPVLGHQKTRERLSTKLGYQGADLTIPLALIRDPDTLPERLIIESSAGFSSLMTFDRLKEFLPGEIKAAIPPDFPLKNLTLTELSLEVGADESISVNAVRARVEVLDKYPIVEYKNLVTFANPGLELRVTRYGDEWQVEPYVMGNLELAGGKLTGFADLSAKSFFCALDDDSEVDLKVLLKETFELGDILPRWDRFALTCFEISGNLEAKMFALDIGTSMDWPLDFGDTTIDIKELFLSLEYAESSFSGTLGGTLALGGVTARIAAKYDPAGWTFEMAAYNIGLTDLLASVLHLADEKVEQLPKVVFPSLELTVTPKTGAFKFDGKAEVSWQSPFGMDGEFDCTIGLTLEREAAPNGGNHPAVACNIAFEGKGVVRLNGRELSSTLDVSAKKDGDQLVLTARGTLLVGNAQFKFEIAAGKDGKELSATWEHKDSEEPLNLKDISEELPDLPGLEALIPKRAHLQLNFSEKRLLLGCEYDDGAKAAFLLKHDSAADTTIVALGLKPGAPISTKNLSLGALGSALEPYGISLDDLVVVAANASAPKGLKLPDWKEPFTKGLLLGGVLKFEGTSFSYPFECRLGSEEPEPGSLPEGRAPAARPADGAPKEIEQGKNNVEVGRTIGPITFRKARLESRDGRVYVLLDASLGSGGFDLDLTGFNLNFPLTKLTNPRELVGEITVGLDGLSIAYSKPPLTIAGGFAKTVGEKLYVGDVYSGHVLIKASAFQITVLGKYGIIKAGKPGTEAAIVENSTAADSELLPSLFLYGMYDGVVGGPAPFFVTGLALGGGYNTRLALPKLEEVADFPLIQAAANPAKKLTSEALNKTVLPSPGDYWLAVGVKFNSFKMADSFALCSVSFGSRLQFALLGFTKLIVPTGAPEDKCAAYAELVIRAVLDPAAGVFSIQGQLTENSYVFGKQFRLTGGFAFLVWFGNAKEAGDFVISLGGYHPDFLSPPHYPVVPRVGISAKLSDALSITGEAYLALTPSCLMAGLKLAAVFEAGNLQAAFVAYADFLIAWAPFHYDASIGIGIAVTFWRFKLELSASLHVWGPPFGGTARVSLWIVSFTVEFGDQTRKKPDPLNWPEFQEAFLPARVSTIRITEGLVREVKTDKTRDREEKTYRIVNSHELMIETDSVVPCSEVRLGAEKRGGKAEIGISPMEATNLISTHVVSIKAKGGTAVDEKFRPIEWSQKNYPEALWSANKASGELEAKMVKDVPSGLVLRVKQTTPEHRLGPFPIEKFKYEPISPPKKIRWSQSPPRLKAIDKKFPQDPEKILPMVRQIRDCLPNPKSGRSRWNEIAIDKTFAHPNELFQELPPCVALGQSLSGH